VGVEEAELGAAAVGDEAIADWEVVEPHDIHSGAAAEEEFAQAPPAVPRQDDPAGVSGGQGGLSLTEAPPPADGFASEGAAEVGPGHPVPRLKPLQRDADEELGADDGPRTLADLSGAADRPYFARREVVTPSPSLGQAEGPAAASPAPAAVTAVPRSIAPPPAATPAPQAPTPVATPASATGTFLVQVASFRSPDAAQQGWTEFHDEFGDLLDGFAPDVAQADLGDRGVRYRLRVGVFTNRAAASAFCDQVKARDRECLVVGS
jgi:hypothetical protein